MFIRPFRFIWCIVLMGIAMITVGWVGALLVFATSLDVRWK